MVIDEASHWDWKVEKIISDDINSTSKQAQEENEEMNNQESQKSPNKRTRSLSDIYAQCNITVAEPTTFEEVAQHEV